MPVCNLLLPVICNKLKKTYPDGDIDTWRYGIHALLSELEKTLYLCLLFTLFKGFHYFLLTSAALMTMRLKAGGYHSKSTVSCFAVSFFVFFLSLCILPLLPMGYIAAAAVSIFSIFITYCLAPIIPKEREFKDINLPKEKLASVIITMVWIFVGWILMINQSTYADPLLWIVFLQSVQLLLEKWRRRWQCYVKIEN